MIPALYQIRQDHLIILQIIQDSEGEITEDIERALTLTQDQFQEKAVSYSNIIKTFDADEATIDVEIKRLEKLKERKAKAAEVFKTRLTEAMIQFGVEKIETPTIKISLLKSESVEIEDESLLPADLKNVKITVTPDKKEIKNRIKGRVKVPGASLKVNQNLQIK